MYYENISQVNKLMAVQRNFTLCKRYLCVQQYKLYFLSTWNVIFFTKGIIG
jgi:hypothetical protein